MADGVDFKIEGVEDLNAKLKSVSEDVKSKGGRFALRKAANLVRDAAKRNATTIDDPRSPEDISKNIAVRWSGKTFKRTGDLMFRVGVMGGAGGNRPSEAFDTLPGADTRHWRHVEFGTEKTRAQPFFQKALSENVSKATNEFVTQYGKAIDRAIKRARKTGK